MQYFLYLFSVKTGLKISFNNGLDRKGNISFCIKRKIFKDPKIGFFQTHAFDQKMQYFFYFFSVKIGLEIRFNNVLDRKQTFIFV